MILAIWAFILMTLCYAAGAGHMSPYAYDDFRNFTGTHDAQASSRRG